MCGLCGEEGAEGSLDLSPAHAKSEGLHCGLETADAADGEKGERERMMAEGDGGHRGVGIMRYELNSDNLKSADEIRDPFAPRQWASSYQEA